MRRYAAVLFTIVLLAVPVASAVVPGDTRQAWPIVTSPELNATGINITNHSIPSRYGIQPTLIHLEVEVSDTLLPGPKGEMAAGPRTIDPFPLAILIVAIIAGTAGMWYLAKRRPEKSDEGEDKENGD